MSSRWTITDSEDLYAIRSWSRGLFRVNDAGHVVLRRGDRELDLRGLADDLVERGIEMPVLLRLGDVLESRIESLVGAFEEAIKSLEFQGRYRGVYPIKVNQDRYLVEDVVRFSKPHHLGLECGSKPELLVVLALQNNPEALIICNGYKDDAFLELALLSRKLGRNTLIVLEQPDELERVLRIADRIGIEPALGVRAKLTSRGKGRWEGSSGDRAKFGLSVREIVSVVHRLEEGGQLDSLRLLHFHIGSQVSHIRNFKNAFKEAGRIYTELVRMGAKMGYMDVGGGLGVDYDGSRTDFSSSMNYDLTEYTWVVVSAIQEACDAAGVAHPDIVTECGRAMVAHSSVLIVPVLGVNRVEPEHFDADYPSVDSLRKILEDITLKNLQEPYHDAIEIKDDTLSRFNLGLATLEERAAVDAWFWRICRRLLEVGSEQLPEELEKLPSLMADTYYCNFSVFQSAPDSWAIDQLFPIMPLQRLGEEPKRRAVLVDLTCDSDGKINKFIDLRDVKNVLEVHEPNDEPYYLGIFLLGAYQEILGDLHNLFGDTNAVHVDLAENEKGYHLRAVLEGDTIEEALNYVHYEKKRLVDAFRGAIEAACDDSRLSIKEGRKLLKQYRETMDSYTYLGE
ncbi:MAG: biosynthetic arginine decarboxylase [Deltaproteobacteria bacterium]|nr:MAG: biosynthetic arginine decarboxylase [Deltaproteobacteria bacterium]